MATVSADEIAGNMLDSGPTGGLSGVAKPPEVGIHGAVRAGDRAAVRLQLARGVSPAVFGPDGWAPLHLASARGDLRLMALLVGCGASVDQPSQHGCAGASPLHCAAAGGHADAVAWLIEHGARADARDDVGFTPLHIAATRGDLAVARALIRGGACPGDEVAELSALALARQGRHHQVAALLAQVLGRSSARSWAR